MTTYTISTTDSAIYNGIPYSNTYIAYPTYTTGNIQFDSQKLNSLRTLNSLRILTSEEIYKEHQQAVDAYEYFINPPKVIKLENMSCYLNLITLEDLKDKETTLATLRRFIRWGIADLKAYRDADTSIVEDVKLSHLALLETFGYQNPIRCKEVLTDIIKIYRRILFASVPLTKGIPSLQPYRLYKDLLSYIQGYSIRYTLPNSSTMSVEGISISATSFNSNQLS